MSCTQGPWTFEQYENIAVYGGSDEICEMFEGDQVANARLICAALDLLDACYQIDDAYSGNGNLSTAVDACLRAIAKAEGRKEI